MSATLSLLLLLASDYLTAAFHGRVIVGGTTNVRVSNLLIKVTRTNSQTNLYCAPAKLNSMKTSTPLKRSGFYSKPAVSDAHLEEHTSNNQKDEKLEKLQVPNAVKAKSLEDMRVEEIRLQELDTLLDTFYSIMEDKEQLVLNEENIIKEMSDRSQSSSKSPESTGAEIIGSDTLEAVEEKREMVELQRICCQNIGTIASGLAVEIYDTREMMTQTRNIVSAFPDFVDTDTDAIDDIKQSTYIEMRPLLLTFRNKRDLKVLDLINQFNIACSQTGMTAGVGNSVSDQIGENVAASVRKIIILPPVRQSMELFELRKDYEQRSNKQLVVTMGKTLSISLSSIVAVTSSLITASVSVLQSSEGKVSLSATSSAIGVLNERVKGVLNAVVLVFNSPVSSLVSSSVGTVGVVSTPPTSVESAVNSAVNIATAVGSVSSDVPLVALPVEGIVGIVQEQGEVRGFLASWKEMTKSGDVKTALTLLGTSTRTTRDEVTTTFEVLSSMLRENLRSSSKWRVAVSELLDSFSLLIAVLTLTGKRIFKDGKVDKQLPESE